MTFYDSRSKGNRGGRSWRRGGGADPIGPCAPRVHPGSRRPSSRSALRCGCRCCSANGLPPRSSASACPSARPLVRDRRPSPRGEWVEAEEGIALGNPRPGAARRRGRSINAQSPRTRASRRDTGRGCPGAGRWGAGTGARGRGTPRGSRLGVSGGVQWSK